VEKPLTEHDDCVCALKAMVRRLRRKPNLFWKKIVLML